MTYWPPVYPLIESVPFALFGYSFEVSRNILLIISGFSLVMMFVTGLAVDGVIGLGMGVVSVAILANSHIFQVFSLVEMLEVPGVLFVLISMATYLRYLKTRRDVDFTRAVIASTVLFFCKFNFGLMWIIPMIGWELKNHPKEFLKVLDLLRRFIQSVRWRNASGIMLIGYMAFLMYLSLSGGWDFKWQNYHVFLHSSLGNPLYILVVLLLLKIRFEAKGMISQSAKELWSTPTPVRQLLRYMIAPVMVWFAYPPNFNTFFYAITNNSGESTSFAFRDLLYYVFEIVNNEFPAVPYLGLIMAIGFFASILTWKILSERQRVLFLGTSFAFFLATIHPHHDPRFITTVLPLVYLSSLSCYFAVIAWLAQKNHASLKGRFVGFLVVSVLATIGLMGRFVPSSGNLQRYFEEQTAGRLYVEVLDYICQETKTASTTGIFGHSYFFSPDVIKWNCANKIPHLDDVKMPTDLGALRFSFDTMTYKDIVDESHLQQWIVIRPDTFDVKKPGMWREPENLMQFADYLKTRTEYTESTGLVSSELGLKVFRYRQRVD